MNRRELIKAVLRGERVPRIPRALFGGGLWAFRNANLNIPDILHNPRHFGETLGAFYGKLDTDIVFAGSGLNSFPAEAVGGTLAFRGEQAPLLSFPVLETTADAAYLEQIDISHAPHALALIEAISALRASLPDRFLCATSWGPFTWAMILCDWELLRRKVVEDPEFIQAVCELGVRLSLAFFVPLLRAGTIDGISVPDGAVTLIPMDLYEKVVLPCERSLFEAVRSRGVASFLHQCGNIAGQISLYPETGADCISIDAGVSIGKTYQEYRERVVTAGNVDVINTIFGGNPDTICSAVSEGLSQIPDPRSWYILMPSCDLPPETPLRNAEAFLSCADRH